MHGTDGSMLRGGAACLIQTTHAFRDYNHTLTRPPPFIVPLFVSLSSRVSRIP